MQLGARCHAEVVLATPQGRIDHANVSAFEQALAPLLAQTGSGGALVLDLSTLEYISSVGLRAFMVAERTLRERQARLVVAALSGVVKEIFAISRFDRVFSVAASVDAALAQCSPAARASYAAARSA
jgi:anti-sigma B factor antagonist